MQADDTLQKWIKEYNDTLPLYNEADGKANGIKDEGFELLRQLYYGSGAVSVADRQLIQHKCDDLIKLHDEVRNEANAKGVVCLRLLQKIQSAQVPRLAQALEALKVENAKLKEELAARQDNVA